MVRICFGGDSPWEVTSDKRHHDLDILLACNLTQGHSENRSDYEDENSEFDDTLEKRWIVHELFMRNKRLFEFFEILFDLSDVFRNVIHFDLEFFKFRFIDVCLFDIVDWISQLVVMLSNLPGSWDSKTQQANECGKGNRDRIVFKTKVHI